MTILEDSVSRVILAPEGRNIELDVIEYDGEVRTSSTEIAIKHFKGKKYLWTSYFRLGWDEEGGYWANSKAISISTMKQPKKIYYGYELGDTIILDGQSFTIAEDHNENIKFI